MPARTVGNSCVLLLLFAAGLCLRCHPASMRSLFVLAREYTTENAHDGRPHIRAGDFGRGRRKRDPLGRQPNRRPSKRPGTQGGKPKKKPGKRPNGRGKGKNKGKGKDDKKKKSEKDRGEKKDKDKKKDKPDKDTSDKSNGNKDKGNNENKGKANRHKLIGYWHNFVNGAGCPIRLADMSDAWDVIDIAFADNDRNSDGTVHFNLFSAGDGCPGLKPAEFKRDMAALQARGKVFVLSLGGAEGTITLNTDKDEKNFVASLTDIVLEWGFDGIDVDLESGSGIIHGSEIQKRLGRALLQVEKNLRRDLYLTMAPEHPYVHGGIVAYDGPWGAYLPVIEETRGTLDLLHVQLYNNGGLTNPYSPGGVALEGTVDMMVAHAKMLVEGFELANGKRFRPLRGDQVAIGLPSGERSASSGQAPTQNILDALDCLTQGRNCGFVEPSFNYVNFGGVMTWSINWDQHDGYVFSEPVGEKMKEMNSQQR